MFDIDVKITTQVGRDVLLAFPLLLVTGKKLNRGNFFSGLKYSKRDSSF